MNNFTVFMLQYKLECGPQEALAHVLSQLDKIAVTKSHQTSVYVLPEMWLGGPKTKKECADWILIYNKGTQELKCRAKKLGMHILTTQLTCQRGQFFNSALHINESGSIKNIYNKIHLFTYGGEAKIFSRPKIITKPYAIGRIKVAQIICYDLRFPELCRELALKGAQIIFVQAQWPESRKDHWLTLLKARAIENQIFIVGVNRLGTKKSDTFSGDSIIFDPWGNKITHLDSKSESAATCLDLKLVDQIRNQYPFFKERRLKKILWK